MIPKTLYNIDGTGQKASYSEKNVNDYDYKTHSDGVFSKFKILNSVTSNSNESHIGNGGCGGKR